MTTQHEESPRRFLCPGCAQEIEVLREHFGKKVECSLCKRRFKADVAKDIQLREQGRKAEQERVEGLKRAAEAVRQHEDEERTAGAAAETLSYARPMLGDNTPALARPEAGGWIQAMRAVFGSVLLLVSVAFLIAGLSGFGSDKVLGFVCFAFGLFAGLGAGSALSYSVALYGIAAAFFIVGMANLGEPAVAGLLSLMVGLMICLLVSLNEIRRALERRADIEQ